MLRFRHHTFMWSFSLGRKDHLINYCLKKLSVQDSGIVIKTPSHQTKKHNMTLTNTSAKNESNMNGKTIKLQFQIFDLQLGSKNLNILVRSKLFCDTDTPLRQVFFHIFTSFVFLAKEIQTDCNFCIDHSHNIQNYRPGTKLFDTIVPFKYHFNSHLILYD